MGMGDELMASGQARSFHQRTGKPTVIVGVDGRPRWSELWAGLPYILKANPSPAPVVVVRNGPNMRPYIQQKTPVRWKWQPYKPVPAEIVFTSDELIQAAPAVDRVMIEPNVNRSTGHTNKDWGFQRWQALVGAMPGVEFVQCVAPGSRALSGVMTINTPTFRHAAAVLRECVAFVGTEGGLMHAAAAVGVRAVIVRGEFIGPDVTGYEGQHSLFRGHGLGCGMRLNCARCRAAMASITVAEVAAHLRETLE